MEDKLKADLMDKLTKTCICRGVSGATIKRTIRDGAKTLAEVKRMTGAGSGACGGTRCSHKIEQLLAGSGDGEEG